jgi:hypothetical protein
MKDQLIIVKSEQDFKQLIFSYDKFKKIAVEFSGFTKEQNTNITEKIVKNYFECGCKTGGYFLFLAIVVSVICWITNASILNTKLTILNTLYFYIICGLVGKITGILISKIRLVRLMKEL